MEDRFAQQLKKGVLEMLVLKLICEKPAYGYELLSELKKSSQGRFCLKEGTLYPILYRLEDDGMIRSQWSTGEGPRHRRKSTKPRTQVERKISAVSASGRNLTKR